MNLNNYESLSYWMSKNIYIDKIIVNLTCLQCYNTTLLLRQVKK